MGWTTSTIPFSLISSLFWIDSVFSDNAKFLRNLPQLVFRKTNSFVSQTCQSASKFARKREEESIYPCSIRIVTSDNKEHVDHYSQTVEYRKQLCCYYLYCIYSPQQKFHINSFGNKFLFLNTPRVAFAIVPSVNMII
jgi:hypothetical protein